MKRVCSLHESSTSHVPFLLFSFPFASFLSLPKAVMVILAFIMMCQLMFEVLNMYEILLLTLSREFIVQ